MAAQLKKSLKRKSREQSEFSRNSKKSLNKMESSGSVQSKAISLQLEDEVPDFPRGGGGALCHYEEEQIRAEVDAEFKEEQRGQKKLKKKKEKKNFLTDDDLGSLFGDGISGRLPRVANKVTLKNICPGMKLWGVIAEVNEKDLVISLPGGLRGLVRASEASDLSDNEIKDIESTILSRLFHVRDLVSCIVLQVEDNKKDEKGKRKIWLSMRLSLLHKGLTLDAIQEGMVLTAYVKSIEDHGYILHFGSSSFNGFLPIKDQGDSSDVKLNIGQLLQGVVRSIDKVRKVVYLISDPQAVSKCVTKDLKGISIDLLIPGMMVNARVQSTLENGILLSFLTYFTGTVDIFHLNNSFPGSDWKGDYSKNKRVNARILFIDPITRAVGLTLNPHLVSNKAPPSLVGAGEIYDHSRVVRVDRGLGLLLEIPSAPVATPAYVSIFDVADGEVQRLEKRFKEGSDVRVRILGFKHLEGLAMGLLKASAFEGSVFTHSDVKPGMVVKAKVIAVESFGAIVQFSSGVKALCPLPHMSEFDIAKPPKKFKVGAELVFRVLGCKSKRITVTHKKTLVKSKLGILSSYDDAADGFVTHGWITKIEKHGCFVRFYNGVQGFASRSELGLDPGCEASAMYHVGQVVKCRVINAIPASRRINLSFIISPKRIAEDDMIKPGSMVSGVVEQLTSHAIIVHVNSNGYSKGTLLTEHLADHQGYAALMKSILKPGHEFSKLLVLDVEGRNLILSAKYSLINSAEHLPLDLTQIQPQAVLHGYICNLIETGCFVRFLGRLTGFCPRNKATDDQIADLSEAFYIGQSVRSKILCADGGTGRITLSLKQSSCASSDASFLHGYFFLEQEIAKLQITNSKDSDLKWIERFSIGSVVEGVVQEAKEFGVVISFHDNIFGFITHYQMGGLDVEKGSTVRAAVLDISKAECLVDLTLKPEFICRCEEDSFNSLNKKKHRREACNDLEVHQTVNAIVEIVKENYLVLSVPECNYAIGYASLTDYNTQKLPQKKFVTGQSVVATIEELPSPLTTGRLLLLLKSEVTETSSSKRAKKKSSYSVGSLVQAEITDIKPLELRLKFGFGFHGRIHITEASEDNMVEDLFSMFKIGQLLTARIVSKTKQSGNNRRPYEWELSIRPKVLSGFLETEDGLVADYSKFSTGKYVTGYVVKVDTEWIWLTLSRHVMAQVFFLDISCEPSELQEFRKKFKVGRAVSGHILSINKDRNLIRLVLRPLSVRTHNFEMVKIDNTDSNSSNGNVMEHIQEGDVIGGRISRILPGVGGLLVQIGPHLYGKVHFTEIIDGWLSDPLSGYHEGQFVKCKVLEINQSIKGSILVDISLRVSFEPHNTVRDNNNERVENVEHLQPNMVVQGYVKNVSSKGCFIMLSRKVDAKILLSNLSEGYVLNPEKDFPVGKLVTGKVSSVEPLSKRVEVSLRTSSTDGALKSDMDDLSKLRIGDVICGTIKQIEPYGLFITIDGTNMVGLCHVSELSDDHIDNIESKYGAGERVTAKILKVDEDRRRISLGMKSSYMKDGASIYNLFNRGNNQTVDGNGATNNSQITVLQENASSLSQVSCSECENAGYPVLAQAETRASILPLDVTLDNMDGSDNDNVVIENQDHVTENSITERKRRQAKRKAKEARELEIRAAEERLLEKDIPQTEDEYEKLVRSSPNSSFIWIKYMAFMLSLADIEKARSIAERALRTINIREEAEKLNIWVAYLNLENEYGNPPEEAVMKTFQRALQYCDPKKVHLALLSMYERTGQYKLADELLDKMIKKFKYSCKVWLRRVECYLKQGGDGVQSIVNRTLLSLPRNKHIKFISHVAILEFKCGVPDRGRSMFEGILREYPKRTDLWSIYLDQEIRLRDAEVIRALFERAISLSLPPKKMKFLFKKYLEYEKSCGDEERIESVKRKAMEYVESTLT